jgi:hypothetical protein
MKVYILLEKISWNVYFRDIVTVQTDVLKNNYIFWKPVKFPIILYIYIFICTIISKNKSRVMNTSLPETETESYKRHSGDSDLFINYI